MWSDRLREILYPTMVVSIIGSLWFAGRAGEMESDIKLGLAAPREWQVMRARLTAEAEADARAAEAEAVRAATAERSIHVTAATN